MAIDTSKPISKVTVNGVDVPLYHNLQDKIVTPLGQVQTITADEGYDGLGEVIVQAVGGLQEKNVDITSNGTIEVLPDGEYTGLSKVNINANVPNKFKSLVGGDIVNVTAEDLQGINNISSYSFYYRSILNSVEIPSNITSIGSYSFQYCRALNNLILHEGIQTIGDSAFAYCDRLTEVIIPNTVTIIGQSAFSYCQNLTSITIPDSVTSLRNYAFSSCSNLTTVNLGNGLTSIPQGAFQQNKKLVNLSEIPNSVTSIGNSAFYYCSGLTSITIPNSVTSIGNYVFQICTSLKNATIGSGVTTMGSSIFQQCVALTTITMRPTTPPTLANTNSIPSNVTTIEVPAGSLEEYKTATNWSSFADRMVGV